jgi:hypothetical protein
MATNAEAGKAQIPTDPATLAFEALREEVTLVRRAVVGLAAERAALEIPDYSETLAKIVRESAATTVNLKMLAAMPALRLTAQDWAREIAVAGNEARRSDLETLTQARDALRQAVRELTAKLTSAKSADNQRQWLLWTGTVGFFAGIVLFAIAIGPVVRAMPDNWHWPERIAANIVRMDQESAGARLIAIAAPDRWRDIVLGYRIVSDNRDAIAQCRKGPTSTRESVRCAIEIKTETFPQRRRQTPP